MYLKSCPSIYSEHLYRPAPSGCWSFNDKFCNPRVHLNVQYAMMLLHSKTGRRDKNEDDKSGEKVDKRFPKSRATIETRKRKILSINKWKSCSGKSWRNWNSFKQLLSCWERKNENCWNRLPLAIRALYVIEKCIHSGARDTKNIRSRDYMMLCHYTEANGDEQWITKERKVVNDNIARQEYWRMWDYEEQIWWTWSKKIQSQSADVVDQLAKLYLHVEHHRSQK